MDKNISEQRRTEYDYTELMRSQCEALGWCNDCSFDESDKHPNVDHRRIEYGAALVACYYDGEWSPIKIFPEDTGGFPLTITEAREMALRLHMATCAAQYYQDRMDALHGDVARVIELPEMKDTPITCTDGVPICGAQHTFHGMAGALACNRDAGHDGPHAAVLMDNNDVWQIRHAWADVLPGGEIPALVDTPIVCTENMPICGAQHPSGDKLAGPWICNRDFGHTGPHAMCYHKHGDQWRAYKAWTNEVAR